MTRTQRNKPSARCIRCGEEIEADDSAEVHRLYTQHVVREHGKPAHVQHTDSEPAGVSVGE